MSLRISRVCKIVLDWLAPGECLGCSRDIEPSADWCAHCADALELNPVVHVGRFALLAPFRHAGPVRHAVHQLKYAGRPDFARRLVRAGFSESCPNVLKRAGLVPVPLHPLRLVERGYNQAALLARALSSRWQRPVLFHLLERCTSTGAQIRRAREERAVNVRDAFIARNLPEGGSLDCIWLVDDVVTTGATVEGCRLALEARGIPVAGVVAVSHASRLESGKNAIVTG